MFLKLGGSATDALGLAVFNNNHMVGELTGEDTIYYHMARNSFEEVYYSMYDPFFPQNIISFNLSKKNNTHVNVEFVNNKPVIFVEVNLEGNIISVDSDINYQNNENLKIIQKQLEYIVSTNLETFLYKTAKKFGSDICGFGKIAAKKYLTIQKWNESSWLELYKYSYFKVKVNINIEKSGLIFVN